MIDHEINEKHEKGADFPVGALGGAFVSFVIFVDHN